MNKHTWLRNCRWWPVALLLLAGSLAACGGPPQASPTPIPASVARPDQPTPAYPDRIGAFSAATPVASPQFLPAQGAAVVPTPRPQLATLLAALQPLPSAMGIAPGGAAIFAEPGGSAVGSVPAGGVVTVTGRSANGQWLAVYTDDATYGWTPAGQLLLYGESDLVVTDQAQDPAPVATLIAQAMQPVQVLDDLMAGFEAGAASPPVVTAVPATPTSVPATAVELPGGLLPTPTPTLLVAPGTLAGVVTEEARLNVRTRPTTDAAILLKLAPGAAVTLVGRTAGGDWLQVETAAGTGWAAAEFIAVNGELSQLPVVGE